MTKRKRPDWEELAQELAGNHRQRLRWKVLNHFGLLPSDPRAKRLRDREVLYCALNMLLDGRERQQCRMGHRGVEVCEENPTFDEKRFEELKHGGTLR